eukprot:TRINITY_DN1583_c0_g1_i1.p1 TRINITY_DN1583_c0_g1~~TRINITY_DN1583_c0_g1_i1.p1  ORF type:complete len:591 (-),score=152.86 TRINITY_DN1583_c0_g1_i1:86-1825(-)
MMRWGKKANERRLKNREEVSLKFDTILVADDADGSPVAIGAADPSGAGMALPASPLNNGSVSPPASPLSTQPPHPQFFLPNASTHDSNKRHSVFTLGGSRRGSDAGPVTSSRSSGDDATTHNSNNNNNSSNSGSNSPHTHRLQQKTDDTSSSSSAPTHRRWASGGLHTQDRIRHAPNANTSSAPSSPSTPHTTLTVASTSAATTSATTPTATTTPTAQSLLSMSMGGAGAGGSVVLSAVDAKATGREFNGDMLFKEREDNVLLLKDALRRITLALKRYNAQALRSSKAMGAMAEAMDRVHDSIHNYHSDSVLAEAVGKFASIERELAEASARHHTGANEDLLVNITSFIEEDISHDLKNVKAKYEKARREYDSACSKLAAARNKARPDIFKLVTAEREVIKMKARYEEALGEALYEIDDIELKKETELMDWLVVHYTQAMSTYGDGFRMLVNIESYLEDLAVWCKEWRTLFAENSAARRDEQARRIQEEESSFHKPFVEALQTHVAVQQLILEIAAEEGTTLPSAITEANWPQFYTFIRTFFDPVSQRLLSSNHKVALVELTSALALLDKAKEPVELSN